MINVGATTKWSKIAFILASNTLLSQWSNYVAADAPEVSVLKQSTPIASPLRFYDIEEHQRTCKPGFRLLAPGEARIVKDVLLNRMAQWGIVGLEGNWVMMGPGYQGEIKQQNSRPYTKWCTRVDGFDPIPKLHPWKLPVGDEYQIEWRVVNSQQFIEKHCLMAHYFGFAWCSGKRSRKVGGDMVVTRSPDNPGGYSIDGNRNGSCDGYRCNDRLYIDVDNFYYDILPETFKASNVKTTNKKVIATRSDTVINESDQPQQYRVSFSYDKEQNWSKTDTFGFSQKVTTKNKFQWPLVGETELSIELGANQQWSSANGGAKKESVASTAVVIVAPRSRQQVIVEVYRSSIEYTYTFEAEVSYNAHYSNFMRWSGNALLSHSKDRPWKRVTYTFGRDTAPETNIRYQYNNPHLGLTGDFWDWQWMHNQYGRPAVENLIAILTRPIRAPITGFFSAEASHGSEARYGQRESLDKKRPSALKANKNASGIQMTIEPMDEVF